MNASPTLHDEARGLWLGLLGVLIFAMTLPMTRLAVGPADDPQLPPLFVTAGRAAFAGLLSAVYLLVTRAPLAARRPAGTFAVSALGTVVGFPLFLGLALRQVDAMHAAVVTGLLPLATAVAAALWFRQRPSNGFWACAAPAARWWSPSRWCAAAGGSRWPTRCCSAPWPAPRSATWPARSCRRRCAPSR